MSILRLSSEEFAHEMNKRRCKGIIASYIARAKQPLQTCLQDFENLREKRLRE